MHKGPFFVLLVGVSPKPPAKNPRRFFCPKPFALLRLLCSLMLAWDKKTTVATAAKKSLRKFLARTKAQIIFHL